MEVDILQLQVKTRMQCSSSNKCQNIDKLSVYDHLKQQQSPNGNEHFGEQFPLSNEY